MGSSNCGQHWRSSRDHPSFQCGTASSRSTKLANLPEMRRFSECLVVNYLRLKVGPAETRKV
jgi:hypothetical protein